MSLAEQILDAFPSGSYGLLALLRVLDIVETADVETACVQCRALPVLYINPAFVTTFANTPEKLLMLVMHELHHILLGHTRLFPRVTQADNLVFDAIINAVLCRMFHGPEYTSFFTDFYSDNLFPECFLRPPEKWRPDQLADIPPGLKPRRLQHLQAIYRTLYSDVGADYGEIYSALTQSMPNPSPDTALLGSHDVGTEQLHGAVFDAVRAIVEHWPQPPDPIRGRSWSSLLKEDRLDVVPVSSNRRILSGLLRRVAREGPGLGKGRELLSVTRDVSAMFTVERRTIVLRALGTSSFLYNREVSSKRPRHFEPVHLYLDVSGSIGDLKKELYRSVLECREFVCPKIHVFSTEVCDISLKDLEHGVCPSTGGTSIECVADHMKSNKVRRAVIVTDGYTGAPGVTARTTLEGATVAVALTPGINTRKDLTGTVRHWAELKESRQ